MDLVALEDFNAVAAHGGFGAASRATGRPKASLSRRVRALEQQLGVRLLERGTRALRLTEDGAALHRRTMRLLDELDGIGDEMADAGGRPHGRLRVSVPAMMATMTGFGRAAARFVADHPEVRLEIVTDDRFVDPIAEGFDIVVRANPAADSTLVGHLLRADDYVVAAHPAVAPPVADDEQPVPVGAVVQVRTQDDEVWRVELATGETALRPMPKLRVSSLAMLREAVMAGAGAGLFPRGSIGAELAAGRLVAWGRVRDKRVEVWALHPSRHLTSVKVRLFVALLRDLFGAPGEAHGTSRLTSARLRT